MYVHFIRILDPGSMTESILSPKGVCLFSLSVLVAIVPSLSLSLIDSLQYTAVQESLRRLLFPLHYSSGIEQPLAALTALICNLAAEWVAGTQR